MIEKATNTSPQPDIDTALAAKYVWVRDTQGRYLDRAEVEYHKDGDRYISTPTKLEWRETTKFDEPERDGGAPYWADWFTDAQIEQHVLDGLVPLGFGDAELVEVTEHARKVEAYGEISDLSKSVNGCRTRLDINEYTLRELLEDVAYYQAIIERELKEQAEVPFERDAAADFEASVSI